MTTRESFKPRLRTSDRVPSFGAFAGVIAFVSASAAFFAVLVVFAAGGDVVGIEAEIGIPGSDRTGAFGCSGRGGTGLDVTTGPGAGCAGTSLPNTSMINRSGSRKVKLETLPIAPTSS